MGRLDDIIERNKNPKTSFRKPKAPSGAVVESSSEPKADEPAKPPVIERAIGMFRPRIVPRSLERAQKPATKEINQAEQGETVGRLDRIIARNRKPDGNYRWLKVGLGGIVLFVVLILLLFTDLASPPQAAYPEPAPAAEKPTGVGGVKLWKAPKKKPASAPLDNLGVPTK